MGVIITPPLCIVRGLNEWYMQRAYPGWQGEVPSKGELLALVRHDRHFVKAEEFKARKGKQNRFFFKFIFSGLVGS